MEPTIGGEDLGVSYARHALGQRAELATAAWLEQRGWRVLERRWRCPAGEIDIVALDQQGILVAVEVKLRSSPRAGTGAESITRKRIARLRASLAQFAFTGRPRHPASRIDLVELRRGSDGLWRLSRTPGVDVW